MRISGRNSYRFTTTVTPSGLIPLNTLQIDRTRAQRPFFFTALLPWNFILRSGSAFFLLPRFLP
jgi:hypothetical protein